MQARVAGKIVFIKTEKSDKGVHYKKLQILQNGGQQRADLVDLTDMSNSDWDYGAEIDLPVSVRAWVGKNGAGLNITYWGKANGAGEKTSSAGAKNGASGAVSGSKPY